MKRAMRMLITDDGPVQDVLMAKAKEHHDRTCEIGALLNAGHIKVMEDDDPVTIRLRIEDEFFSEPRSVFPSTTLIARLHLAIHAGRSERSGPRIQGYYEGAAPWADAIEQGYNNVAKITAKVTSPKYRKGLRP